MTAPSPVGFPLGSPSVSGNQLTVDLALKTPTRVTRRIADITLQRFIVSRIFAQGGSVSGGAVVYDQAVLNGLYLERDVERRAPGDEYPLVTSLRQAPKVATVEDWGGKFFVTDEARRRNDISLFNNQVTQLGNTIVRKVNQRAVDTLEAVIQANAAALVVAGNDWTSYQPGGTAPTAPIDSPAADFAKVQTEADVDELGVVYDVWLVNPTDKLALTAAYGGSLAQVLADNGIREVYASNRVTAGSAYAVASQIAGEIRLEQPLQSETWREAKNRRTWLQASVVPVMYVTNPYAVRKVTGLAG